MSLRTLALTADDESLVAAARRVIGDNDERDRHHIGAAVRMRDGRVFVGVHVKAHVRRIALCAEAVALGAALSAGSRGVETVVAWPTRRRTRPGRKHGSCRPAACAAS
jgi:cytidine deaminase